MKNFLNKYSIYIILIFASVVRIFRIGKRDFWYDEAFTGIALKENFSNMITMIVRDVHPPLYYISAKIFSSFLNYSVLGIRLYSVIFGILGVLAVYLFTKELFNKKAALWASLITAISPFAIQYSQEARMYSMFGFLIILASYFFIKGLKTSKITNYVIWGTLLGLSCLTHYLGIIFVPVYFIVFFTYKYLGNKAKNDRKLQSYLVDKKLIIGYALSVIVFLPWIKNFIYHLKASRDGLSWIEPASFADIFINIRIFIFGSPLGEMTGGLSGMPSPHEFYGVESLSVLTGVIIFMTLVTFYLFAKLEQRREPGVLIVFSFVSVFIIYTLSLFGKHYLVARYLLPSAYFIYIVIGLWLSKIKHLYSFTIITAYLVLLSLIIPVKSSMGWNLLLKDIDVYENKNIYLLNSFDYVIAKYYFGKEDIILYNLDWPQYNPENWPVIGKPLKRTENFSDIVEDEKSIVISNVILRGQLEDKKRLLNRDDINLESMQLVNNYENLNIYNFKK